jgi:hypothetical protein
MALFGRRLATETLVVESSVDPVLLGRHDIFRALEFGFDERAELLLVEP